MVRSFSSFPSLRVMWLIWLAVLLLVTINVAEDSVHTFQGSIKEIEPNPLAMTVTSFRYNPTNQLNEWFSSIFGNESVWYNVSQKSPSWMTGPSQLGKAKMEELRLYGNRLVRERLQNIPDFSKKPPPCSIEVLAFGRVDVAVPMMREWREFGPIAGLGTLSWHRREHVASPSSGSPSSGPVIIKCYWRALFENWRKQNAWTSPNFWAMVFFCPMGVHESSHLRDHSEMGRPALKGASRAGTVRRNNNGESITEPQLPPAAGRRRLQDKERGHTSSSAHQSSTGLGRMQCLNLERSHVGDQDGGVVHFNITASLLSRSWTSSFAGRLFPSGSPTNHVLTSRHREATSKQRHTQRIHKYSSGRRLVGDASSLPESELPSPTSMLSRALSPGKPPRSVTVDLQEPSGTLPASSSNSSTSDTSGASSTAPNIYTAEAHMQADMHSPHMAVCCVIPYTTTDEAKATANGQMLLEWVHYYTKLGFRIFVYDREGMNSRYLSDSARKEALFGSSHGGTFPNLHYFNYTIRGLLDSTRNGIKYDNTERRPGGGWGETSSANTLRARYESQGHDKVNSLTHCRFEAKALYGIDRVLAVDFDEFIYCQSAPPNPAALLKLAQEQSSKKDLKKSQKLPLADGPLAATAHDLGRYINIATSSLHDAGLRQITIQQRVTMNKTSNVRDCVISMASRSPPESVFNCYASFRYERASHSIKSFHLGTTCPLTGYHQACPSPNVPRAYDCACPNFDVESKPKEWAYSVPPVATALKCSLFHLSTNLDTFNDPSERHHDLRHRQDVRRMVSERNELLRVAYGLL